MDDEQFRIRARRLRDLAEPIGANVYFAPEAYAAYEAVGLIPPPRVAGERRAPLAPSYFASRGACLGHPPGEVVAAAFGVFRTGLRDRVGHAGLGRDRTGDVARRTRGRRRGQLATHPRT